MAADIYRGQAAFRRYADPSSPYCKPIKTFGASFADAFLLLWILIFSPSLAAADPCDLRLDGPFYPVAWVYDGDSVRLQDGRKVRLIGINTPEVGRDGNPGEPFSSQARKRLRNLLGAVGNRAALVFGMERKDRYGRYLAHLYLPDGRNVAEELLREGLGFAIAIPPNLSALDCYLEAEREARSARRGLWRQSPVVPVTELARAAEGFKLVGGRILRVGNSKNAVWLNLEGGLALRVDRKDLEHFPGLDPAQLDGRRLEARGWIYRHKGDRRMQVRHLSALRWIEHP